MICMGDVDAVIDYMLSLVDPPLILYNKGRFLEDTILTPILQADFSNIIKYLHRHT